MNKILAACALSCFASFTFAAPPPAPAAPAAAAPGPKTAQQSKMVTCNADASGKKGDERKVFMKSCLSAKAPEPAKELTPQQNKMKSCNADAKEMKGAARKSFMKTCLSANK